MKRRLLISFSGGETSAYMTWWILTNWAHLYDEIIIVFANTGQENEETLIFVDQCDRLLFAPLGYRVVWVEAVQHHGQRKRASARLVTFETADRDGAVFEDMIAKYGIPNKRFPHCTRDLKLAPINSYAASLGWNDFAFYDTAIGIRADEIDRMAEDREARRIEYPLVKDHPRRKPQINSWFLNQPFRLKLKGYQSNCRWCWKKTKRKHVTLIREDPSQFDFPRRMEQKYGTEGSEFRRAERERDYILPEGYRRVFFRGGQSVDDLIAYSASLGEDFVPAEDDAVIYDVELDTGGGCEETCEVHATEDGGFTDADHESAALLQYFVRYISNRSPFLVDAVI